MSGEGILSLNELDFRNGSNVILAKLTASANTITLEGASSANVIIKKVADPVANQDAATKAYVDSNSGGTPGGADTNIQFNNSGSFGGSADLTWDGTSLKVTDGNDFTVGTDNDLVITHSGTIGSITNITGNLTIDNQDATSDTIMKLGDASGTTSLIVQDSATVSQFTVNSDGDATLTGTLTTTGLIQTTNSVRSNTSLILEDPGASSNTVTIQAPTLNPDSSYTLTLPTDDGANGQFLQTDGTGTLSWSTPGGSGDVLGPASATANAITLFDGTSGKAIKNSNITYDGTTLLKTTGNFVIQNSDTDDDIVMKLGTATNATSFRVRDSADQDQFYVDMSGAIFTPQIRTGVTGNALGITSGEIVDTVSLRVYKKNERPYEDPKSILKLQPKRFTWKADNTEDLGLIVEDALNKQLNEYIYYDPEKGPRNYKDRSLIAGLISCVKEQEKQINSLISKVTRLQQQISKLV